MTMLPVCPFCGLVTRRVRAVDLLFEFGQAPGAFALRSFIGHEGSDALVYECSDCGIWFAWGS